MSYPTGQMFHVKRPRRRITSYRPSDRSRSRQSYRPTAPSPYESSGANATFTVIGVTRPRDHKYSEISRRCDDYGARSCPFASPAMLSKCANPACGAKFQYLHLGKLFAIEYRNGSAKYADAARSELAQTRECLRYFWLCSICCQSMTIQVGRAGRVRIAPAASTFDLDQSEADEGLIEEEELTSRANRGREPPLRNPEHVLGALVKELEFLEGGGYRQTMGWTPPLIFEDSPICPKHSFSSCPNAQCVLLNFVPAERRAAGIPCQHIPLNDAGETLYGMYPTKAMNEIEDAIREWLRTRIAEIKQASGSRGTQEAAA